MYCKEREKKKSGDKNKWRFLNTRKQLGKSRVFCVTALHFSPEKGMGIHCRCRCGYQNIWLGSSIRFRSHPH